MAGLSAAPPVGGKMHKKQKPRKIGELVRSGYLRMRMRQDDSAAVCMSDKKLGNSISSK